MPDVVVGWFVATERSSRFFGQQSIAAGVWDDRTAFHEARKRGQDVSIEDFEEEMGLHFEPLPCWAHLEEKEWRGYVADLVREIEQETLEMHPEHDCQR